MIQQQRNGVTVIVVALLLPVLLILIGFTVDLAYMQLVRTELKVVTDLAAKAAAVELSDTGKTSKAILRGQQVANANKVGGQSLGLDNSDFVFGNADRNLTGRWAFTANALPINAVQLAGRRTQGSPDGPVKLFLSRFINSGTFEPVASSTASFVDFDICLVLDRSSSMKLSVDSTATGMSASDSRYCDVPWIDSRWAALDSAIDTFVTQLDTSIADEQVALVTFASDHSACGETTVAATIDRGLTKNLNQISNSMTSLSGAIWNGMTEIDDGIAMARTVLNGTGTRPLSLKIIVLLTDGSYTGEDPVVQAQLANSEHIRIHAITFGAGANQTEMQAVAAAAHGSHYHAADEITLQQVFRDIAGTITVLTE